MNWKVLIACAVSVFTLAGCGTTTQSASNAAPTTRAEGFTGVLTQSQSGSIATVYADGAGHYGFFLHARAKITDTWYETSTVGFNVCGLSGCRTFTVPVYKYYSPASSDSGSRYINCNVTDGSTSLKIYASNFSPMVQATQEAQAVTSDDFSPATPSVGNCNGW